MCNVASRVGKLFVSKYVNCAENNNNNGDDGGDNETKQRKPNKTQWNKKKKKEVNAIALKVNNIKISIICIDFKPFLDGLWFVCDKNGSAIAKYIARQPHQIKTTSKRLLCVFFAAASKSFSISKRHEWIDEKNNNIRV